MVSESRKVRASGETQASEEARQAGADAVVEPAAEDPGEEREIKFRTPGFSRIRTEWTPDDALVVLRVKGAVEERIISTFGDAFIVLHEVYDIVRTKQTNEEGAVVKDRFGFAMWERTQSGGFIEDWSKLGHKEREDFLFQITTRIFEWSQRATDAWTEAMLAKAQYEERFSIAYDEPVKGTIEDRTAKGKMEAAEERYFAILLAAYSRKADALVRSLELLGQRLKDAMG